MCNCCGQKSELYHIYDECDHKFCFNCLHGYNNKDNCPKCTYLDYTDCIDNFKKDYVELSILTMHEKNRFGYCFFGKNIHSGEYDISEDFSVPDYSKYYLRSIISKYIEKYYPTFEVTKEFINEIYELLSTEKFSNKSLINSLVILTK